MDELQKTYCNFEVESLLQKARFHLGYVAEMRRGRQGKIFWLPPLQTTRDWNKTKWRDYISDLT